MSLTPQKLGARKNTLLMYQNVLALYHEHKTEDNSVMTVWRKYIRPVYPISRVTLYTILATPVKRELEKLEAIEEQQISLFAS